MAVVLLRRLQDDQQVEELLKVRMEPLRDEPQPSRAYLQPVA